MSMTNRIFFSSFLGAILLASAWILYHQHRAIAKVRAAIVANDKRDDSLDSAATNLADGSSRTKGPSPELVQLRGEVTRLRSDLENPPSPKRSLEEEASDWDMVFAGPKPSDHPDFVAFTNVANVGFATPDAAFQSFHCAFQNQQKEKITNTRMKDLFDVPDDYDEPEGGYSIDLGEGIWGVGYRIVLRDQLATNVVRLTYDSENRDGSWSRREKVLIERNGHWRVRPVSVTRPQSEE